ncbi:MAG TPA: hypothetical protein VNH18_12825 [Bryobacteraceae bacterium]|nr:hypothetical protein [Bryobacteraceae bacterium]
MPKEQLRTFHVAGRGLDELRPKGRLQPVLTDGVKAAISPPEAVYPVVLEPGKPPRPAAGSVSTRGCLAGFSADSLLPIYAAFLALERAGAREKFLAELKQCVAHLQNLLSVDNAKRTPVSAETLAASLGADASRFLAVPQLLEVFHRQVNAGPLMEDVRRKRCEEALVVLETALVGLEDSPVFSVFTDCAEALLVCEQQLPEAARVLRAMRLARLEAVSAYDAGTHDEVLRRFDWQTAEPYEIAALPATVVMVPAEKLEISGLSSFSRLMRSGMPVQILVPVTGLWSDHLAGSVTDIGAMALAHRGTFVLQTSMARWEHLSNGLAEMARTLFPGVAVVCVPDSSEAVTAAWQETILLSYTNAFPLYCYRPEREGAWSDRFELIEPGQAFASLTALDAVVASPRFRDHFRVIPAGAEADDEMELHEYLSRYQSAPPLVVPYMTVTDSEGQPRRVAVTRELVHLCFDRGRAWEMLMTLAARPAGAVANPEPSVREGAAREAYLRVAALLADPESLLRSSV